MTVLKIALVGAPHTGKSPLAAALTGSITASGWQAVVVVADTAALQADLARYDLTLLTGLETAKTPAPAQEAADQSVRAALAHAGVPYRVIYGQGEERLAQALQAVESLLPRAEKHLRQSTIPGNTREGVSRSGAWVWVCDKCSDPQCEHRLLTDLLAQRASTV
ncbi:MAG: hypothetical protein ACREXV_12720 [Polaromonas sp.]